MTYRERRLAKAERLREWAEKREAKSAAGFRSARIIADGIPLGQPILVGHHSEKRHRRDIARIDSGMRAGVENADKATEFQSRAANIEAAADRAIYSDDPDALDALQAKLAELEAKRERMNRCNRLYRKGDAVGLAAEGFDLEKLKAEIALRYSFERKGPFRSYELSNLGGVITTTRKRIEDVKRRQAAEAATESAGGFLITRYPKDERYDFVPAYCSVQFSDKPERAILDALKAAGFSWSRGAWSGQTDKLPACVLALESEATERLLADMGNSVDFDAEGNHV